MNILFVCTGNSCRSPIAEGFARYIDPSGMFLSAGIAPEQNVSPFAVKVMLEKGIDISHHQPRHINTIQTDAFQKIICFGKKAYDYCLSMPTMKSHSIELYDVLDPWNAQGTEEQVLTVYKNVRDEIRLIVQMLLNKK